MRLGLFGGTFDPVHNAHLAIARAAGERFHLDQVLLIPSAHPPWKEPGTAYEHRLKMVELACAGDPRLRASRLDDGPGKSYSIGTVTRARAAYPGAELFFVIGSDAFADVLKWRRAADLLREVEFIVVTRPGHPPRAVEGARAHLLDTLALDVSSSAIRQALRQGLSTPSVPEVVAGYASAQGLYRPAPPAKAGGGG